ncbi:AAA family ATPase [Roseibium sp.]|uniref:AAA family ATPase n=1 Tax=Roseibium sp. TaxID=1936156 RepID=UPI003BAC8A7F
MGEPKLLVLDEPTSALDPLIAAQVLRAVMRHAERLGVAVLIVTHDLSLAARYADRAVIMNAGRVAESGETATLLKDPQSEYGRLLVRHREWGDLESTSASGAIAAE